MSQPRRMLMRCDRRTWVHGGSTLRGKGMEAREVVSWGLVEEGRKDWTVLHCNLQAGCSRTLINWSKKKWLSVIQMSQKTQREDSLEKESKKTGKSSCQYSAEKRDLRASF